MVMAFGPALPAARAGLCTVDSNGSLLLASALWGVRGLNAKLFCVLGSQSLPVVGLHSLGAGDAANDNSAEQVRQNFQTDVPACGAPCDEAAIDVVPERQARAAVERIEFPP